MADARDLLIEIGTEELPPRALQSLSQAFAEGLVGELAKAGLEHGTHLAFATPRRLAVLVRDVALRQADRSTERRGPAVKAAFDADGNPTKAAQGFARSCGVKVEDLEQVDTGKGAWLMYRSVELGRPAEEVIPAALAGAVSGLPIPKRMRWGDLQEEFVRPVHWLVVLFGEQVVDMELLGVPSARETRGHRFHHPDPLYLRSAAAYVPLLETEGHVVPGFEERREAVRAQVEEAGIHLGGQALIEAALLDEVSGLVEWPCVLSGRFDERFLLVPPEVLVSTMQDHQKYFPVTDGDGHLLPHFITVSNIESKDPTQVVEGNQRVIRPRFEDAEFFWKRDRQHPLADRLDSLRGVVFQERIGSLYDKVERVEGLAAHIAETLGGDVGLARRAARLAKCDLMTDMVGEFPELQGTMGRYYALHDREGEEVADAMEEQYLPKFAGDGLPETKTGQTLALADKLDTLVAIFGIGQPPSGDKDPFGLRRAALGVLRILIEGRLDLDLMALLERAAAGLGERITVPEAPAQVFDYALERLRGYYADLGMGKDELEAVAALRPPRPLDLDLRVRAVASFRRLPEAASLAAANKRIRNILRKVEGPVPSAVDESLLREEEEGALAQAVAALEVEVATAVAEHNYERALRALAGLRPVVDRFFDAVLVMAEDQAVRENRIALLGKLRGLFLEVADISQLQG